MPVRIIGGKLVNTTPEHENEARRRSGLPPNPAPARPAADPRLRYQAPTVSAPGPMAMPQSNAAGMAADAASRGVSAFGAGINAPAPSQASPAGGMPTSNAAGMAINALGSQAGNSILAPGGGGVAPQRPGLGAGAALQNAIDNFQRSTGAFGRLIPPKMAGMGSGMGLPPTGQMPPMPANPIQVDPSSAGRPLMGGFPLGGQAQMGGGMGLPPINQQAPAPLAPQPASTPIASPQPAPPPPQPVSPQQQVAQQPATVAPLSPPILANPAPAPQPAPTVPPLAPSSGLPPLTQGGALTDLGAAAVYGQTWQMPNQTVGGRFGALLGNYDPSQRLVGGQIADQARGNQYAPTGAQPLGGYATSQGEFNSRMQQENQARAFGGTLPVRGADGRVTFADGPMRTFGPQRLSPGEKGYLRPNTDQQQRAAAALASNAQSSEARDAYRARNAYRKDLLTPEGRIAGRGNAYELAQARKESRQLNKGVLTFEQRLAAANPAADAQRAYGEGALGLAKSQMEQRAAEAKDRNALGNKQVDSATERAKIAANAKALEAGQPPPYPDLNGTPAAPTGKVPDSAKGMDFKTYNGIASMDDEDAQRKALRAQGWTKDADIDAILDDMNGPRKGGIWGGGGPRSKPAPSSTAKPSGPMRPQAPVRPWQVPPGPQAAPVPVPPGPYAAAALGAPPGPLAPAMPSKPPDTVGDPLGILTPPNKRPRAGTEPWRPPSYLPRR